MVPLHWKNVGPPIVIWLTEGTAPDVSVDGAPPFPEIAKSFALYANPNLVVAALRLNDALLEPPESTRKSKGVEVVAGLLTRYRIILLLPVPSEIPYA